MEIEEIKEGNLILVKIIRSENWVEGLHFASKEEDFLQVGFWKYNKGEKLLAHIPLFSPRTISKTQEVIFIKRGCVRADIYNEKEDFVKSVELKEGDTAVFLNGGHGYEILEDNTQVLEIKNGPYIGKEKDKKLL